MCSATAHSRHSSFLEKPSASRVNRFIKVRTEYPKAAWYEAVVNACVHRSYGNGLRNSTVYIRMFDDRLEIESPGAFLPFVNPENIYSGMSCPRNPQLMLAMYFLRFVKMAAEGTRRMRDTMAEMGLPQPEFAQKEIGHSRVRVTLRNDIQHRTKWLDKDVAAVVGSALARVLSVNEKRILNFVAEHKSINVTQSVRLAGLEWGTAKKALTKLEGMGILKRIARDDIDRDPKARYIFPDDDADPEADPWDDPGDDNPADENSLPQDGPW